MTAILDSPAVDYRALMKKVEEFVESLARADDVTTAIHLASSAIVSAFQEELGIYGGRLYRREEGSYVLINVFPEAAEREKTRADSVVGVRVPRTYGPIEQVLQQGILYMAADDPALDRSLESLLGVEEFAAIEVGNEEYIVAFNVRPSSDREDVLFSLGILRHAIDQKVRRERMVGLFNEAQRIQESILPKRAPRFGDYDIAGRSVLMEGVGGDFYDYISITDKILGVAIADVSGHGLPAALQVRDIYTGLRMGMARDFKIVRTIERLNGIIHGSTLTSRFVSMFYGELEHNGLFIYVNAGHPPPFRLRSTDGGIDLLEAGGAVLGPLPNATYERGFVTLKPGDVVVLFTDGITEAPSALEGGEEEEFGAARLESIVRQHRHQPSSAIVEAVFRELERFGGGQPQRDDRTLVVVRYAPD